nr:retrotransposon protein, putative, Ty1-copia subclass [Tanacetum cinerariifolium]
MYDVHNEVACLMLGSMTLELHRQFENYSPYEMLQDLSSMFEKQARVERFDLIQTFHAYKQEEGKSVVAYVLQIKGYIDQLECLGYVLPQDIMVGIILNGLTKDFVGFVRNYNMHNMEKMIGKGKDKKVYIPQPKNPKPKEHLAKDDACHHCKEVGHGKMNYPIYLAELLKKKKQVGSASFSGIFTIELFAFLNKSWVYDTGCGTHICITKQGFRKSRKLKQEALYLYVGNGVGAQVEAIRSFDLVFPNCLVIWLDNCHYVPSITRGFVSVHRLVENGFVQCFTDYGISVSKNNVFYFNAIPSNGIYEIDMHDLVPNVNSIYNVSTKRAKHNLDSIYLWHYRLAHIRKMTRKSFPHRLERATDLLRIINSGPLRHVSRQGDSYFITFTDDYSRYGYVYLLKHKHELTPPYTPQHNGVSEKRNRTLLDMVRSIMNLTTLPLSFWDYALKSAICILNMVPIKKVNKTPYELWYGKVPNLSYLKIRKDTSSSRSLMSKAAMLDLDPEVEEHSLGDLNDPASYKAAMLDLESNKWIDAINAEIQSMIDNMVWVLVDLLLGCKTVRGKWIFKKKTNIDGIVHTYKARLIAKGYTQLYGVDYKETFSPIADIRAIRILISIVAFYDYEIWKMDVKTAFLNGYLNEDIYMVQPEGFVDPNHPRKVCKLQRSIYGLKQASRSWNKIFVEEIKRFSFDQNLDEPCVYQKASGSNVTFLILYVDDIIIMRNHILSLQSVKNYLGKCFAMKDLGEAAFILGIKIYKDRSKRLIGLGQNAYMDKILKRYKMDNSKRGYIPMQERLDLNRTQGASTPKKVKRMQNVPYASTVGSIIGNLEAELRVDCYCDAGFENDRDDTKSQTGYVFILNEGAVD